MKLAGHQNEGFGLAWSPITNGQLLSGSDDEKIIVFDVNTPEAKSVEWKASGGVEDVKWSNFDSNMFASAQQD